LFSYGNLKTDLKKIAILGIPGVPDILKNKNNPQDH
jgi:hypothetical protein